MGHIELPRISVALLESEAERLHTPGHELSQLVLEHDRWDTMLFSERSVGALIRSAEDFDCIVIARNALYHQRDVAEQLAAETPRTNIVVLDQPHGLQLTFLGSTMAAEPRELRPVAHRADFPGIRDVAEEPLLHWPLEVDLSNGQLTAVAEHWLRVPPRGGWRVVFEVARGARRHPVLLRTSASRPQRLVLCTLELERSEARHMALLENMITFCGIGRLDVVTVVGDSAATHAVKGAPDRMLTDKLRLQGAHVVELGVPPGEPLPFATWPLRGARYVVLPAGQPPNAVADEVEAGGWLRRGGTLVSTQGDTCIWRPGATDVGWVRARWGAWFGGTGSPHRAGNDGWLDHIHRARAVLRTLDAFSGTDSAADGLGLPAIGSYEGEVRALLRARVRKHGDCDEIISTTAAALDLDKMFHGKLLPDRAATEAWLRERFDSGALDDQLDIARSLGDARLLRQVLQALPARPLTALTQARLREALLACTGIGPDDLPVMTESQLSGLTAGSQLADSLQLAAEYVESVCALDRRPEWAESPLTRFDTEPFDRALSTLQHRGRLAQTGTAPADPAVAEEISVEARALLAYFAHAAEPMVIPDIVDTSVPLPALQSVLHETEEARKREAEATARALPVLRVQRVLGWGAVAVALGVSVAVVVLKLLEALDVVPLVAWIVTCFTAVSLALAAGLIHVGLFPPDPDPLTRFVSTVNRGLMRVARATVGRADGPSANEEQVER